MLAADLRDQAEGVCWPGVPDTSGCISPYTDGADTGRSGAGHRVRRAVWASRRSGPPGQFPYFEYSGAVPELGDYGRLILEAPGDETATTALLQLGAAGSGTCGAG